MRVLRRMGLESLAWSARRIHCPVDKKALVLDVGSGGNPYPRANVLLDAYEDTVERYHLPLIKDRPLVYGVAEKMPFKDKAFDFVIASHILEHTADPEAFISELMRVGKAGYIETPDALFERLNPFRFHRLEVTDIEGKLVIFKKPSWRPHQEWVDMYERKWKDRKFFHFLQCHPSPFYVRYYWQDEISYEIRNPEIDASWPFPESLSESTNKKKGAGVRSRLVRVIRSLMSQRKRNRSINLLDLLICPACHSAALAHQNAGIVCNRCGIAYPIRNGVPQMFAPAVKR